MNALNMTSSFSKREKLRLNPLSLPYSGSISLHVYNIFDHSLARKRMLALNINNQVPLTKVSVKTA